MPRALDPMWEYDDPEERTNRQSLFCKLCGTRIKGGVYRLKYHLAKILGFDVGPCNNVSPEIMRVSHDAINAKDRKKEESATKKTKLAAFKMYQSSPRISSHATEGSGRGSTAADSPVGKIPSYFVPRAGPGGEPSIKSVVKKREQQEASRLMGRCLFWSDLPLTITRNNPFWQSMCDAIAVVGLGFKAPSYEELRGPILQAKKKDINARLGEFKESWESSGCTVMSDGWTDGKGRTLLNFLVHCPKGSMFIKLVDASAHVKDAALLCELLHGFIEEIGAHHVVQIVTDNAAN
jgi:hypothetical protein